MNSEWLSREKYFFGNPPLVVYGGNVRLASHVAVVSKATAAVVLRVSRNDGYATLMQHPDKADGVVIARPYQGGGKNENPKRG